MNIYSHSIRIIRMAAMRKRPQQQRAKLVVDSILEATLICISEMGLDQITTPKISEKSGVSVGSIYQYFENKDQIILELLRRKSENLGLSLKALAMNQEEMDLKTLVDVSLQFGFDVMREDNGFFFEVLKHWHGYNNSEAAKVLEKHFFEVGLYVFNRFYRHWDFETLKHKSFVIINSTLFTMMRFVSNNDFLISEQQLKRELSAMILSYLDSDKS